PASVASSNPSVASLPELLTGGTTVNTGDVVANKVTAGNATLSAQKNLTLVESQLQTTGDLNLLAKDTVFVRDSVANPFVAIAGGNLYVQGNQKIDILALNHPQTPFQSGVNLSLVSDGIVSGDAHFASGGQFKISNLSGEPGNFVSLFDPIIFSLGDVELGDYTGASLHILAGGSVTVGDVEINGTGTADDTINPDNPDSSIRNLASVTLSDGSSIEIDGSNTPTLDIRAGVNWDELGGFPQNNIIGSVSPSPNLTDSATDSSITVKDVTISSSTGDKEGTVFLTNQFKPNQNLESGPIITGLIDSGSLAIDSRSSVTTSAFPFTVTGEATIQSTGQTTTLSLSSPTLTSEDNTIRLTANINPGEFTAGEEYNVAFVIDVSGSTERDFGDIDGDNIDDSVLDAEKAAFNALNQSIIDSGAENNTTVGVIPFATRAETIIGTPSDVNNILTSLEVEENYDDGLGRGTNYRAAIGETINFFDSQNQVPNKTNNLVFFVSDGSPGVREVPQNDVIPTEGQINRLTNDFNANITALGIVASNISESERTERLENLQILDPNAELVEDPSSLEAELTGGQIDPADVQEVKILVNGNLAQTLSKDQLETSGSGLKFNSDITGLQSGDNSVEVQVIFDDQDNTTANATQNVKVISPTESFTEKNSQLDAKILVQEKNIEPPELQTPNQQERITTEAQFNTTEQQEITTLTEQIEEQITQQFLDFSGTTNVEIKTVKDTQGLLSDITQKTGVKPAVVYTRFLPEKYIPGSSLFPQNNKDDVLNIIIVTAEGKPIRKQIKGATRAKIKGIKKRFTRFVSKRTNARNTKYLAPAKQLYEWLVKPYETEMEQLGVKNLMFINDEDLRDLPVAALHDGKQFIIEKYSVGLLPSLSLSDTRYVGVKNSKVLAMGSSTFTKDQDQKDLPAVPIEISSIAGELWSGKYVSGENFTLDNLKKERANTPYGIIHLATHANFPPERKGGRKESYIQLYDSKLRLEDVRQLGWNIPPVELLVLSACRTAIGDPEAELGYAGLAVQTGVKSAVASLWKVSDSGTLGLMTEFYRQLNQAPIKAEALRQTQLAMLQGKVRIEGNQFINSNGNVNLSRGQADDLKKTITGKLSHPHYWASFTMIGSPW
ncbi:MAG: CHAT domain-containing protein, partial [Rivularia sp. (in: cyanobacteria)]